MASLTAKTVRGRKYYYLRECRRVNGKPKIVKQIYLGSSAEVAAALSDPKHGLVPLPHAPVKDFGALAALFDLATRIGFVDIVDRHVPKRIKTAPSVGAYLLLAALNRCVAPRSKAKARAWYEGTSLSRWLPFKPGQVTSQRFWDNMDRVDEAAIRAIEGELTKKIVELFDLDLSCFFYDATNFFTFIDSFNEDSTLAQRGKSKEGRTNLRILGLALIVTADHHVPLFHHIQELDESPYHIVGSLVPTHTRTSWPFPARSSSGSIRSVSRPKSSPTAPRRRSTGRSSRCS